MYEKDKLMYQWANAERVSCSVVLLSLSEASVARSMHHDAHCEKRRNRDVADNLVRKLVVVPLTR